MSDNVARVYEQYAWRPEYEGLPRTYGGFAIIPGVIHDGPGIGVCIKQRNGNGSSPYLFDLPGGGVNDATDPDLGAAAIREAKEEVGVDCRIVAAVGEPLYLLIKKDGVPVRVDCARAFLVQTNGKPAPGDEAIAVAFVHEKSFAGFNVVSRKPDPASPVFGRTPVMIFDGLSVLKPPSWKGRLTNDLRAFIIGDPNSSDFLLVSGGAYLGRTFWHEEETGRQQHIALYRPPQPRSTRRLLSRAARTSV